MPEYSERIKNVAEKRLLLKAMDGTILEDIAGMFKRVATYLGSNAEEVEEFYTVMANNQFLPNSPCLVNAGVEGRANQLAACFVIDIQDSLEDIYDKLKASALIFKSGGGVGFNFSNLRAANSIVSTTKGVASGPVSFMQIFDASVEGIKQGGVRRGAAMGILRVDHPDIEEFIQAKLDGVALQNFNISVAVTNKFMMALIERKDYELICPQTKKTVAKVSARKIFDMIVDCAWKTGDPGVVYIDRMNDHNPLRGDSNLIVATNPCGEEPLADNECCGLGSINLSSCVIDGKLDLSLLRRVAMTGTKFLGRMLMASEYPSEVIDTRVKASRKIGLGHMGFADVLIKLKIAYTSEEAIEIAEQIGQTILDASVAANHQEGQKLGTFPLIDAYVAPEHIKKALEREGIPLSVYTPAYSALTTIAPTGTLSILAECSSGVEPVFYLEQEEHRADAVITHLHPLYAAWKATHPTSKKPYYFQDLKDIDVSTHIAIQSTFQRYVCSAISKTINMPFTATKEMVAQAILESYHTGCKGITIYRDGSKATQVIYDSNGANHRHSKSAIIPDPRPETLDGTTYEIKTGYGIMLVTINSYDEQPFEVICQLGKSGASEMAKAEAISRLASILLRCGVDIKTIISQLEGIVGGNPIHTKHGLVTSIPDALAKIMQLHTNKAIIIPVPPMMKCEDCGAGAEMIEAEGSCLKCTVCGWKSCS